MTNLIAKLASLSMKESVALGKLLGIDPMYIRRVAVAADEYATEHGIVVGEPTSSWEGGNLYISRSEDPSSVQRKIQAIKYSRAAIKVRPNFATGSGIMGLRVAKEFVEGKYSLQEVSAGEMSPVELETFRRQLRGCGYRLVNF